MQISHFERRMEAISLGQNCKTPERARIVKRLFDDSDGGPWERDSFGQGSSVASKLSFDSPQVRAR